MRDILKKNPNRELERCLGYRFKNKALLERALLHRSFRFEHLEVNEDNQRLEFLGDAVLGMVTAAYLFNTYAQKLEGEMTSLRSRVTSGKALAGIARDLDLGPFLKIGKGEVHSGGRNRKSNLADALEAVIGAVWLDGGLRATEKVFQKLFKPRITALSEDVWEHNPKGRLQELTQARWKTSPAYRVKGTQGPPHDVTFSVDVTLPNGKTATGTARSKQKAEAAAARTALGMLDA